MSAQLSLCFAPSESRQSYPRQARSVMPAPSDSVPGRGASSRAEGERLGDLCADKAEEELAEFRIRARQFVLDYLRQYGATSGEVITDMAIAAGLAPHDARAFGPVFAYLAHKNRRQIVCVGLVPRQKGHGTAGGRVWALA